MSLAGEVDATPADTAASTRPRSGDETGHERRNLEPLWTPVDVAAYLNVLVQTLYQWRRKRSGPPCRRVGRHLRYEPTAVRTWFSSLDDDGVA